MKMREWNDRNWSKYAEDCGKASFWGGWKLTDNRLDKKKYPICRRRWWVGYLKAELEWKRYRGL